MTNQCCCPELTLTPNGGSAIPLIISLMTKRSSYQLITTNTNSNRDDNSNFTDEDDLILFRSVADHESKLARMIIRIKNNDARVTRLLLNFVNDWDERSLRRLGCILGQNTTVEVLQLLNYNLDVAELCAGIRHNRHIKTLLFNGTDLQETEKLRMGGSTWLHFLVTI